VALVVAGTVAVTSGDDNSDDPVAAVVEADDAVVRQLSGSLGGSLTVVYAPSVGATVLDGSGVPSAGQRDTYQVWLVGAGEPTSVGLFRPDSDGEVAVRFDDVDPTEFVVGITREPAGGSEQPTLPILASA
jgi:anti-sigma-K factor RskA